MIRRLTKRTELEIVAQWPKEGDITDDAAPTYITSLLSDCSPDVDNEGKLSSRAPEELMRLLVRDHRAFLAREYSISVFAEENPQALNARASFCIRSGHVTKFSARIRKLGKLNNMNIKSVDLIISPQCDFQAQAAH